MTRTLLLAAGGVDHHHSVLPSQVLLNGKDIK
jgi:hypothetical protein